MAQKSPDGAEKVIKCFCCGEKGHYCNKCPKYNDIEWNDWYLKPLNDKGVPEKPVKYETEQPSQKVSWSGTQVNKGVNTCQIKKAYMLHQEQTASKPVALKKINFNEDLVLDTGAMFSLIRNKSLLAGVHAADAPIQMCTNTGERVIKERGTLLGMDDKPWLDENLMANIISFSELVKQYRVTYDTEQKDCFYCHTDDGIVEFERTEEGFYCISLPEGVQGTSTSE